VLMGTLNPTHSLVYSVLHFLTSSIVCPVFFLVHIIHVKIDYKHSDNLHHKPILSHSCIVGDQEQPHMSAASRDSPTTETSYDGLQKIIDSQDEADGETVDSYVDFYFEYATIPGAYDISKICDNRFHTKTYTLQNNCMFFWF